MARKWTDHVWVTTQEAADYLRVHRSTVQRYVREGILPASKVGGNLRLRASDVDAFLVAGAGDGSDQEEIE
jgi:excisionase family DNA binding protein